MERFLKWTVRLLSGVMLLGIIGVCVIFYGIWHYGRDLPDYTYLEKYEPPIISRVYAGNGRLIGEFASEKRVFVPIKAISKRIIQAFIAAEDQRFYSHSGMDFMGIARAAWSNLTSPTGRLVGASTITQQVAKNFLLTNERSYERKIKELILSSRIEKALTKGRILELYLNQIYLGSRSFGVAAAAQTYFGKSLEELTIAEAAYLAALPKAPKNYHPIKRRAAAVKRRNYVIGRMLLDGYITREEAETARAAPLVVVAKSEYISVGAEYFVEEVRRELLAKYGEKKMADGGYVVRSTLDPRLQQIADKVGVHVTTVSRAVDDKWVQTARGIFPLKRFFVGGTVSASGEEVAWDAVRIKLQEIIDHEDKQKPSSDDELVKQLASHGLTVARRTVTKYRKSMGIPSSRQRRDWRKKES